METEAKVYFINIKVLHRVLARRGKAGRGRARLGMAGHGKAGQGWANKIKKRRI